MEPEQPSLEENSNESPGWTSLTSKQRRVVGVLVEKSKTTPQSYPMTLNAIRVACNQKSNRSPIMDLDEDDVEDTLIELKEIGAVTEIHSGGRALKYRHQLYDWLGVEKAELAVMCELLLRGAQTLGDLRARAARMEKISGLSELKPIVGCLLEKDLMLEITPPGRGQIVTHNLYEPRELERVRQEHAGGGDLPGKATSTPTVAVDTHTSDTSADPDRLEALEDEVKRLWQTVNRLEAELESFKG